MRIIHIILALLFLLCTVLQFNDPDPLKWCVAYGLMTLLFVAAAMGRYYRPFTLVLTIVLGIWALTFVPDFIAWLRMGMPTITGSMKAESPHVELVREFLGLVICLAALVFLLRAAAHKARG